MRRWTILFALALCLLSPMAGFAQTVAPPAEVEPTTPPPGPVEPLAAGLDDGMEPVVGAPLDAKRERPKVDGVAKRVTVGEALLWVPRVLLYPLYLVSEFVVRKPIGWAITTVEKNYILPKLRHYTTIGEKDGPGVYAGVDPIARFDTGFRPAIGLLFWAERLLPDTELRLGLDTDFVRNATIDAQFRAPIGEKLVLTPLIRFEQRDDFRFYGVGPDSLEDDESLFFRRKLHGGVRADLLAPSPGVGATLMTEVSSNRFDCSDDDENDICGPDGVVDTADDRLQADGFVDGYELLRVTARIYADSRAPRPASSTGARAEVFARWGQGLSNSETHFIRSGAEGALFWDIFQQRVLGLRVLAETTVRSGDVPFAELILPGGSDTMRGFSRGRLHGASLFVASLDYRYPIWSLADGTIFVEAGNVFDELSDLEVDALRGSFGFGIRTVGSRHASLDLLIAAGTTRFDDPNFGLESVRFSIGTNWGF